MSNAIENSKFMMKWTQSESKQSISSDFREMPQSSQENNISSHDHYETYNKIISQSEFHTKQQQQNNHPPKEQSSSEIVSLVSFDSISGNQIYSDKFTPSYCPNMPPRGSPSCTQEIEIAMFKEMARTLAQQQQQEQQQQQQQEPNNNNYNNYSNVKKKLIGNNNNQQKHFHISNQTEDQSQSQFSSLLRKEPSTNEQQFEKLQSEIKRKDEQLSNLTEEQKEQKQLTQKLKDTVNRMQAENTALQTQVTLLGETIQNIEKASGSLVSQILQVKNSHERISMMTSQTSLNLNQQENQKSHKMVDTDCINQIVKSNISLRCSLQELSQKYNNLSQQVSCNHPVSLSQSETTQTISKEIQDLSMDKDALTWEGIINRLGQVKEVSDKFIGRYLHFKSSSENNNNTYNNHQNITHSDESEREFFCELEKELFMLRNTITKMENFVEETVAEADAQVRGIRDQFQEALNEYHNIKLKNEDQNARLFASYNQSLQANEEMRAEIEFLSQERSQQLEILCVEINELKQANASLAADFNAILEENTFLKEHAAKLSSDEANPATTKEYCDIIEMELTNKIQEIQRNKAQIAEDEMMIRRYKETINSLSATVAQLQHSIEVKTTTFAQALDSLIQKQQQQQQQQQQQSQQSRQHTSEDLLLEESIDILNNEQQQQQEQMFELRKKDSVNRSLERQQLKMIQETNETLERMLLDSKQREEDLIKENKQFELVVLKLENEIQGYSEVTQELKSKESQLTYELEKLKEQLIELSLKSESEVNRISSFYEEREKEFKTNLANAIESVESLRVELARETESVSQKSSDLSESLLREESLKCEVIECNRNLQQLLQEKEELIFKHQRLSEELFTANRELKSKESMFSDATEKLNCLLSEGKSQEKHRLDLIESQKALIADLQSVLKESKEREEELKIREAECRFKSNEAKSIEDFYLRKEEEIRGTFEQIKIIEAEQKHNDLDFKRREEHLKEREDHLLKRNHEIESILIQTQQEATAITNTYQIEIQNLQNEQKQNEGKVALANFYENTQARLGVNQEELRLLIERMPKAEDELLELRELNDRLKDEFLRITQSSQMRIDQLQVQYAAVVSQLEQVKFDYKRISDEKTSILEMQISQLQSENADLIKKLTTQMEYRQHHQLQVLQEAKKLNTPSNSSFTQAGTSVSSQKLSHSDLSIEKSTGFNTSRTRRILSPDSAAQHSISFTNLQHSRSSIQTNLKPKKTSIQTFERIPSCSKTSQNSKKSKATGGTTTGGQVSPRGIDRYRPSSLIRTPSSQFQPSFIKQLNSQNSMFSSNNDIRVFTESEDSVSNSRPNQLSNHDNSNNNNNNLVLNSKGVQSIKKSQQQQQQASQQMHNQDSNGIALDHQHDDKENNEAIIFTDSVHLYNNNNNNNQNNNNNHTINRSQSSSSMATTAPNVQQLNSSLQSQIANVKSRPPAYPSSYHLPSMHGNLQVLSTFIKNNVPHNYISLTNRGGQNPQDDRLPSKNSNGKESKDHRATAFIVKSLLENQQTSIEDSPSDSDSSSICQQQQQQQQQKQQQVMQGQQQYQQQMKKPSVHMEYRRGDQYDKFMTEEDFPNSSRSFPNNSQNNNPDYPMNDNELFDKEMLSFEKFDSEIPQLQQQQLHLNTDMTGKYGKKLFQEQIQNINFSDEAFATANEQFQQN